jgi:flagellar hook-length control protein FliK
MKSDPWGPVSVRATLSNGQFGAEIQVGNRDAHAALTEGLNGLEKALGDKGIQVVSLGVSQGLGYGHSESQGQQEKHAMAPPNSGKGYTPHAAVKTGSSAMATTAGSTEDFVSRRVSVRA